MLLYGKEIQILFQIYSKLKIFIVFSPQNKYAGFFPHIFLLLKMSLIKSIIKKINQSNSNNNDF